MVKHKGFQGKTTLEERWYGTQYNLRPFTGDELSAWNQALHGMIRSSLHLPTPNPFIATDFTLFPIPEEWKSIHEQSRAFGPAVVEKSFIEDKTIEDIYLKFGEVLEADSSTVDAPEDEEEEVVEEEETSATSPTLLQISGRNHLTWFLQDSLWKVPKVNVFLSLKTGYAYHSPLNMALCEVFADTLKENLNEFSYYADCAGLYYDIAASFSGFEMSFSGYHDKLPLLVTKTLEEMKNLSTTPELFSRLKEKILRTYANTLFTAPYNHCVVGTMMCLEDPRWSSLEKYHALKSATIESFRLFSGMILKTLFVEMFISGNITSEQSHQLSEKIRSNLSYEPLAPSLEPLRRSVQLQAGVEYQYRQCARQTNPNELNSAIENSYLIYDHVGYLSPNEVESLLASPPSYSDDIRQWSALAQSATLSFLCHLINEPIFDQLRTKEQLGYLVHSSPTKVGSQVFILPHFSHIL